MRASRRHVGTSARFACLLAVLLAVVSTCRLASQDTTRISEAQSILSQLVESYGVSGAEGPVRATVQRLLPTWAKSETDTAGNLWVRVGQGPDPVVIIAHLDEIGFRIDSLLTDGSLVLRNRGGFFPSLFEAKPALRQPWRCAGLVRPNRSSWLALCSACARKTVVRAPRWTRGICVHRYGTFI